MKLSYIQHLLVYLFTFSLVFENWTVLTFQGNTLPKIIAYLLVLISLLKFKRTFSIVSFKRFINPLFFFVIILAASYFLNLDYSTTGLITLFTIIQNVIFFWILVNIFNQKPTVAFNAFFALIGGVLLSAIFYGFGIGVEYEGGRLTLFGDNPNSLGVLGVFAVLFIISIFFENRPVWGKLRFILLLFLIPLAKIIAETGSRVSFFALLFSVSVFFLLQKRKKIALRLFVLVFGVLAIYYGYKYLMSYEVLQTRVSRFYEEGDVSGRESIWERTLQIIIQHPFLGAGLNGFKEITIQKTGAPMGAHNVFLELLAISGILGFSIFMYFIYLISKSAWQIKKLENYNLPVSLLIVILASFFSGMALTVKVYWVIYAYIVTSWKSEVESKLKPQPDKQGLPFSTFKQNP